MKRIRLWPTTYGMIYSGGWVGITRRYSVFKVYYIDAYPEDSHDFFNAMMETCYIPPQQKRLYWRMYLRQD